MEYKAPNLFADDTLITIAAPTLIEAVQKVNEDLENLQKIEN